MSNSEFMNEAIRIAERSTHKKHMTGCVIRYRQDMVATGWSHMGTWRMRELYSMHAELHTLLRSRHVIWDTGVAVAYIATVARKSGNVVNARPCLICATALIAAGINTVYYSESTQVGQIPVDEFHSASNDFHICKVSLPKELQTFKVYNKPPQ